MTSLAVTATASELPANLFFDQLAGAGAVRELERKFAEYYGKRYALAVANATLGLYALAQALGLRGREVITTPLTWGGSVAGPLAAGARILFSDVDSRTLALDADTLPPRRRSKVVCILAVDYLGVPADDAALRRVADSYGWWYVHDAAQSFGAKIAGRPAGSRAHAIVASFSAGKALCAGEGGVVVTDDADLYDRLVWTTQHPDRQKRDLGLDCTNEFALNIRINPLAAWYAAKRFDSALKETEAHAARCRTLVQDLDRSALTVPLGYEASDLAPSFFRLTASRCGDVEVSGVTRWLVANGHECVGVREAGLVPLYAKLAGRLSSATYTPTSCPTAEREARFRFELLNVPK